MPKRKKNLPMPYRGMDLKRKKEEHHVIHVQLVLRRNEEMNEGVNRANARSHEHTNE